MNVITDWFRRYFSDPQAVLLVVLLMLGFGVVLTMGRMLAPVLAAMVIAYLLEGIVAVLEREGGGRTSSVILVFLVFMTFLMFLLFGVVPLLWTQTVELIRELPSYVSTGRDALLRLPEHYAFISEQQVNEIISVLRLHITNLGQRMLSLSISSIPGLITLVVYLILVPLLVFFFLKDKHRIVVWVTGFLPRERSLASHIWHEVDIQIGNYVRGKFWEILIIGVVTYVIFALMDLKYAILLGVLVGLSVLVPYIGAAVVTFPVAVIAYFQFGWTPEFAWIMVAYGIIQAIDGNLLVPLLFSEVVNLHPVAIIVAVLVFGGMWGVWGVFFAIPLATLVNALIRAWPRTEPDDQMPEEPASS
ncbi:AI-2E family transporter [Thiohalomonas denitrificans]|uniref:Putative permease n=1 Tax=Thiohalomonas denitrificans TaxID=415747 RepID=A0A1G5PYY3_9GAMM|nr:AI-2E family transporter [Thiohalomonas denitrificans]SCZ54743.1 putative permease [Thiohalomonas denitrificans]